eukprot:5274019-Alexandrium_andersonii.AAC.1
MAPSILFATGLGNQAYHGGVIPSRAPQGIVCNIARALLGTTPSAAASPWPPRARRAARGNTPARRAKW